GSARRAPHGVRVPPLWTARARGGSEVAEQRASEAGQDDRTIRRLIRRSALTTPRATPADTARRQRGTPPARRAAPFPRFRPPAVRVGGTDARVAKPAAETPAGTAVPATAAAGRAVPAAHGTGGRAHGTDGRTRGAGGPSQRRRVPRKSPMRSSASESTSTDGRVTSRKWSWVPRLNPVPWVIRSFRARSRS